MNIETTDDVGLVIKLGANTPAKVEAQRRAQAAVAQFFQGKEAGPVSNSAWMGEGYLEVCVFNRRVHLSGVFVLPDSRHKGLGTLYLKALLDVADAHGSEVECSVEAFGARDNSALNNRQLLSWYKRHGFCAVKDRRRFMVRPASAALL